MKKILSNIILFFLVFAVLISFTGCNQTEQEPTPPPIRDPQPKTSKAVSYETLKEYEAWLSNTPQGDWFITYQKISMLGEFSRFTHETWYGPYDLLPQNYFTYTLLDGCGQSFKLLIQKKENSRYRLRDAGLTSPEVLELNNGIQGATDPNIPYSLYVPYNSIQFEYERIDKNNVECKLRTIMWECTDNIFVLSIYNYPFNVTDTFLGQMLTSFEAAEAGIKALNIAMFEFSDES